MIDAKILQEVALTQEEYHLLVQRLGRQPTFVELGMFGALWSEHCGYKNSKPLLQLFPNSGKRVLVKAGEENAGVVDIGDGLAVVLKMESHNHPSAIEPFQGAATGVGGIIRDIFTMGARPVAILDSLRFGPLTEARNRYLFSGVVGGISAYGNCVGIPTVGGEIYFAPEYTPNPIVNVMCVGVVEQRYLTKARAVGRGNALMLVGADTGRDGIHGATFASVELNEKSEERRPAVQVGNPFLEKLLIEACLDLVKTDYIIGMQDLGAAGLTSAAIESAARSGAGLEIDVQKVSRRESGMTPYEVMLSESQERMLVVVKKGYEDKVRAIFERWELHSDIIGWVTDDGLARIRDGETVVAEVPIALLTAPPVYHRQGTKPPWLSKVQDLDIGRIPSPPDREASSILLRLLASPNIASKEYVYRQYDHTVLTNTVIPPGHDAAILRIKGTRKAIAVTTDGNPRYCYLDPYAGGAISVAEAARNLVCVGATPLAMTNCLNFGNPEKTEIFYQLEQCVRGMARACEVLDIPVVSGNVSLYNETEGQAIYPTPVVGMVGLLEDMENRCTVGFRDEGDVAILLGGVTGGSDLAGSEYLATVHSAIGGKPAIDLDLELRLQQCCLAGIQKGIIKSAHDCSEGGLAVALAESCIAGAVGCKGELPTGEGWASTLFGEEQSRILVSVAPENAKELQELADDWTVPSRLLGRVGGHSLALGELIDIPVESMERTWRGAIEKALP